MTSLLDAMLAAHGGLDRWRQFNTIEATIVSLGKLWEIKGQPQDPEPRQMTAATDDRCAGSRMGIGDDTVESVAARVL